MSRTKLLLADDSITIQKVVNLTFADQGMDVVAFSDGDAAIENLDEVKPDIVLADVHMPGINGYQVCELIRSSESTSHIPVLLLVGSFEPFDREEAERVGSSGHLTKPFKSIAELVSTVQNLLASASADAPTPTVVEVSPASESRPDTSDIDALYEQSFAETVEIPQEDNLDEVLIGDKPHAAYDDDAYDDEMIQTSYAGSGLDTAVEEVYYTTIDSDEQANADAVENEAGWQFSESPPETPEPAAEPDETSSSFDSESEAEANYEPVSDPDDDSGEGGQTDEEEGEVRAHDPFESVAGEIPASEYADTIPNFGGFASASDDLDLLELPGVGSAQGPQSSNGAQPAAEVVTSLSPELIEMIVQKVVERLDERGRSTSGN